MSNRYQLVSVQNAELVAGLLQLVQRGNGLTAEVLAHLAELEERMLHLELGYASPFAYCVQALGMSEGAAGRRVAAARICRRFPEAFALVARGDLHLSALCALAPHLTNANANASELFEACLHRTRRQVDELLAVRFPQPNVREQIRRLPEHTLEPLSAGRFGVHFTADAELRELIERARAISSHALTRGDLARLMKHVFSQFVKREEARRFAVGRKPHAAKARTAKLLAANPQEAKPRTPTVDAGKARSEGHAAKARAAKLLAANPQEAKPRTPTVDAGKARSEGHAAKACTAKLLAANPQAAKPRTPTVDAGKARSEGDAATTPPGRVTRHIPAAVRHEVYARDHGQCSFVAADGRRCEARGRLELDHVEPWARGGAAAVGNIRLRCRAHNQLHARKCFGAQHIAVKVAVRRMRARHFKRRCSRAEAARGEQVAIRAAAEEHRGRS